MNELTEKEYLNFINEVAKDFRKSQLQAAMSVNSEMLRFYLRIGERLDGLLPKMRFKTHAYEKISSDLKKRIPGAQSFSPTNIRYMWKFYRFEKDLENLPQAGARIAFSLPWGHLKAIIDACGEDREKAVFFMKKAISNGWSRAVLLNFLDTDLYKREGRAISNFSLTLPKPGSDLAQEATKDPYQLDFLSLSETYSEKQLKDALMDNLQKFLLELGTGFSFVGREYRLLVGKTEQFIDMLFYNFSLHRFVVIEMKTREFKPEDMGQLSTYVAAVDGILKKEGDDKTIGLLICKSKDNVLAKYSAGVVTTPIGISEYHLGNIISEDIKDKLPSIDEIEKELGKDNK